MSRYSWPILPGPEASQSNTFGPLIALGIDGARVTFPDGWIEHVFIDNLFEGLPFTDFEEFREYIKDVIRREFGNSSLKTFLDNCDAKSTLHLKGKIQEKILYSTPRNDKLESFFGYIVANSKRKFAGKQIIAEIPDAPGAAAAAAAPAAMRSPEGGTTGQTQAIPAKAAQGNSRLHELTKLGYNSSQLRLASTIINDNPTITLDQLIDMMVGGKRRKTRRKGKGKKTMKQRKVKRHS